MKDLQIDGTQAVLTDKSQSSVAKYRKIMVGDVGWLGFVKYEIITGFFSGWPGAMGMLLRRMFFPCLFKKCGKGVIFSHDIMVRHPHRISIGNNVVIGSRCTLDAKGARGDGIIIGDNVFISEGTIITMADGTIVLDDGCNIGCYCRIGTFGYTRIGKKALLAAFCYIVGAYHETDRTDIPILDQPNRTKGGAEVGDGCWLGTRVTVLDGIKIGNDSIVGAHSLVTKDLSEFSVAAGIPARRISSRKESLI